LNDDEDRWQSSEPPPRGPSAPPDLHFSPVGTALGVFVAIAIPSVVVGYTRPSGSNSTIIVLGIVLAVVVGILAGIWVANRGGDVWRGPQL
jgi:hypothetical protein